METMTAGTSALNSLLRVELSAVETYAQALNKIGNEPEAATIRRIASEHSQAASWLREEVIQMGAEPSTDSGAWGNYARAVLTSASLLDDATACQALKEGEEQALETYQAALSDGQLSPDSRLLIRFTLIPQQRDHLAALDSILAKLMR